MIPEFLYFQGIWKCKVVDINGRSVSYIPLEGYADGQKGKVFTADRALFTELRSTQTDLSKSESTRK